VPQDLASLVPAKTALLIEVDDLGGRQHWRRETTIGRIWAEPEMQRFVRGLVGSARAAFDRFQQGFNPLGMVGLEPQDLEGIRVRRAGLALVDASPDPNIDGRVHVDLVLTVQFRQGAEKGRKIARALRDALQMFSGLRFEDVELGERTAWVARAGRFELCLLAHGDRVVFTTQLGRMEQVAGALDGPLEESLSAAPRFAEIRATMEADRAALFAYADVPRLAQRGLAFARRLGGAKRVDEFERLWGVLGLDAVKAAACADVPAGPDFRTEMAVTLKERRGLFGLMQEGSPSHRFARYAPADCLLYAGESYDLAKLCPAVVELAGQVHPSFRDALNERLAALNEAAGIDVERDLLSALGTEWGFYAGKPPGGGLLPEMVLFASLRDRARFERSVATMVQRCEAAMAREGARSRMRTTKCGDLELHVMEMTAPGGDPLPVAPSWAVGEDFVVAGLSPLAVRHALMDKAALAGRPEFSALARSVPGTSASTTYLDTRALVGWLYNSAVPLLQGLQGAANRRLEGLGLVLNLEDLPPARTITRHLTGTMFYTSVEDDAVRTGWVSPFGAATVLAPAAAAGLVVAGAAWLEQQEQREANLRARLRRLQDLLAEQRSENASLRARLQRIERKIKEVERQLRELD